MADYFAVLQRTLSGFADPKPELRSKLYERARSTIERQLAGRNPPVTGDALTLEMERLEQAIVDIEGQYNAAVEEQLTEAQPESAPPAPEPAPSTPAPEPESAPPAPEPESAPPAPEPTPAPPAPEPAPPIPEPVVQQPSENHEPPPIPIFDLPDPEPVVEVQPEPDPIPDLALEIPTLPLSPVEEPPVEPEPKVEPAVQAPTPAEAPAEIADAGVAQPPEPAVDPVEEWAKEFLSHEPSQTPAPEPEQVSAQTAAAPIHEPAPQPASEPQFSEPAAHLVPQAPEPQPVGTEVPAAHELPTFDPATDGDLGIPPAPGFSPRTPRRSKKRGGLKWLLLLILLGAIAAAGYFGWQSRATLVETFGLSSWFVDPLDPQTPKKVKTIIIKPDSVEPVTKSAEPETPKEEIRIPAEGTATDTDDKVEIKPVPASAAPPVSQSAVLYEEGGTAADSTIDRGRVLWSIAEQSPLEGLPAEPVIQGRIEVPSRKLVLNMTIKRNADKSLPASHVVDLNFAVPSDFSGGAIGQIRSLVFKSSEQGQGKALIGVPVQIKDGQFILALNNLESAQKTNVELMKTSGWIDVPMLYRTGRRAFITIEKGSPGEKIFEEVLTAWGQ